MYSLSAAKPKSSVTLDELWSLYEQGMHRRGLSDFTIKHEVENFSAIAKHLLCEQDIATLTTGDFEHVFDQMRGRNLAAVTINGRIKTLRRMMEYAQKHDLLLVNHATKVEKMKETEMPIHSLTLVDMKNLLAQPATNKFTGVRDRTMMQLLLDSGIRLRETLDLTVEQVDLKHRQLKEVHRKTGKIVDIPISRPMTNSLEGYLDIRGTLDINALFVTIFNRPISRRTFQENVQTYGELAGIEGVRVSPHTLRHTFAKFYILNGGDPFSLQHILGHSNMNMVRRYVTMWGHEVQVLHDKYSPLAACNI